jgi:hypothetical protein
MFEKTWWKKIQKYEKDGMQKNMHHLYMQLRTACSIDMRRWRQCQWCSFMDLK